MSEIVCGGSGPTFHTSVVISESVNDTSVDGGISAVAAYRGNVYLGTISGTLRHYHLFDDAEEYMLISEVSVSGSGGHNNSNRVKKILILESIERALVVCGNVATVYTLPEFTPCSVGKLRDVNDVVLGSVVGDLVTQVIAFTLTKIRLILVAKDLLKLVMDVNYSHGITGVAMKPSIETTAMTLVANESNYDIVDLKQVRKIPLFEYNSGEKVNPHIVPFSSSDEKENTNNKKRQMGVDEEYMLSIRSDEKSSIAMFIDLKGDVTRGTLSWMDEGYPESLAVEWPYAFGVFLNGEGGTKLVISDLEQLVVVYSNTITGLNESSDLIEDGQRSPTDIMEEEKEPSKQNESDDKTEDKDDSDKVIESKLITSTDSKNISLKVEDSQSTSLTLATPNHSIPSQLNASSTTVTKANSEISVTNKELTIALSQVDQTGNSMGDTSPITMSSSLILHDDSKVWIIHRKDPLLEAFKLFSSLVDSTSFSNDLPALILKLRSLDSLTTDNSTRQFLAQLQLLVALKANDLETAKDILFTTNDLTTPDKPKPKIDTFQKSSTSELLIHPKLLMYLYSDSRHKSTMSITFYKGIFDLCGRLDNLPPLNAFYLSYLDDVYRQFPIYRQEDSHETLSLLRMSLYEGKYTTSNTIISFINEVDVTQWGILDQESCNKRIRSLFSTRGNHLALIHVYQLSIPTLKPAAKAVIAEEICRLVLQLALGELKNDSPDDQDLPGLLLKQLPNLYNEKVYAKYLLELLKLSPERGFHYMKTLSKPRFKATHKHIMLEMKSFANTPEILKLQIDYLESTVGESPLDLGSLEDLLINLTHMIFDHHWDESNINNFNVLRQTYSLENNLDSSYWPKISWIDYLRVNMERSECREFAIIYLKIYELLLYVGQLTRFDTLLKDSSKSMGDVEELLSFYKVMSLESSESVKSLLAMGDFSTAEQVAVNSQLPYPLQPYYFQKDIRPLNLSFPSGETSKNNLLQVFQYYDCHVAAIRHFLNDHGHQFSPLEMFNMLPSKIPVTYLEDYIQKTLIELNTLHRDALLTKVLSRTNAKFNREVVRLANEDDKSLENQLE